MIKSLMGLALLSSLAHANPYLEKVCEKSIAHNPENPSQMFINRPVIHSGIMSIRGAGGAYLLQTMEGKTLHSFNIPVRDILVSGEKLWVLAPFDLIEMNLQGEIIETHNFETSGNQDWGALAMTEANGMMVISRGLAGLLGFDLKSKEVKWMNTMGGADDSWPSGLVTINGSVFAAAATGKPKGFTGMIKINPTDGQIEKTSPYHTQWGVMDTDVRARAHNGKIVLNNGGWIHEITTKQVESGKEIKPRWVAKMIQANGDVNAHYLMMNGDFIFENNKLLGCGMYADQKDGVFIRRGKLSSIDI